MSSGYANRLAAALSPGERVLAGATVNLANGVRPPEPADLPQPRLDRPVSRWAWLGVLAAVLDPSPPAWADGLIDRVVFGVAGRGPAGSHASRVCHATRRFILESGTRDTVLAVTEHRLLLCVTEQAPLFSLADRPEGPLEVVWQVPRHQVASARVGRHRLNPKRLRIEFADGSWAAFTVPLAESGAPLRRVADALVAPGQLNQAE